MNILAHLYLSGNKPHLMVGNFMADAIKGKAYLKYDIDIQQGILLHRAIDTFTDQHPIVKQSKLRLNQRYHHFKGIIIDIFYDHYLAKNWSQFSTIPLEIYSKDTYAILRKYTKIYPSKVNRMLFFMIFENWLMSYQNTDEIKKVLTRMSYRTKHPSNMNLAVEDLLLHYEDFENDFRLFFNDIIQFTQSKITT